MFRQICDLFRWWWRIDWELIGTRYGYPGVYCTWRCKRSGDVRITWRLRQ